MGSGTDYLGVAYPRGDVMNKTELYDFFDQRISQSAIQFIDYEYMVVGKTCRNSVDDDGQIDIFICNHDNLYEGLGTRALRTRLDAVKTPAARLVVELNGEGYIKTRDKDSVFRAMRLLGIRKKKQVSQEVLDRLKMMGIK